MNKKVASNIIVAGGVGIQAPKSEYKYMARISLLHINAAQVITQFLRRQNYTDVTVIIDTGTNFYQQFGTVFNDLYVSDAFDLVPTTRFLTIDSTHLDKKDIIRHLAENKIRSGGTKYTRSNKPGDSAIRIFKSSIYWIS